MESTDIAKINAISIAGRVGRERERLIGMTDEERAWRARFVKSQELAPDEPIKPKGYNKLYYNPLRRFYRVPLNKVENALTPLMVGQESFYKYMIMLADNMFFKCYAVIICRVRVLQLLYVI